MDSEEGEIYKVSKINSGMLIAMRLDMLWKDANKHKRSGEYSNWNGDLDAVWCELGGDEKEGGDADKKYESLTKEIANFSPVINWNTSSGFNLIQKPDMLKKLNQYKILIKKELFLRRLQNKQGKGTAYDEDLDFIE